MSMSLIIVEVNEENEGYLPELSQDFCYKKTFLNIFFLKFIILDSRIRLC